MAASKRLPVRVSAASWAGPVSIRKRSGDVVPFDPSKIREAIRKSNVSVREESLPSAALDELTRRVTRSIPQGQIPGVEQVQDLVEETLIKAGYAKTAKAYILYRAEHAKIRQSETDLMEIYKELTFSYAADADIKRENANIDADTAMGTMLKYGSEGAKYFVDNYILPRDVAAAHINGDIHIHDKDFYMLTETCCQIDLLKLFKNGFSTGHGYLREPASIQSYSALGCIAIQANQNEMHGGQSVPNFDYAMAPGVAKTFRKEYFKALGQYLNAFCSLEYGQGQALAQNAKAQVGEDVSMGQPQLYGEQLVPWLTQQALPQGGTLTAAQAQKAHDMATQTAMAETDRIDIRIALVHNLNTMNSRGRGPGSLQLGELRHRHLPRRTDGDPQSAFGHRCRSGQWGDSHFPGTNLQSKRGNQLQLPGPQLRSVPAGHPHIGQAAVPQFQLPGCPFQPAILQGRGL